MTTPSNAYCAALGIAPPRIEDARSSPDANYYSLLLVALLERGKPTTPEEVAARLQTRSRSTRSISMGAFTVPFAFAGGSSTRCCPRPGFIEMNPRCYHLLKEAHERGVPLEVVVGSAPGWADPWSRVRRAYVATDAWRYPSFLVDEQGYEIPRGEVQLARLA